MAYVLREYRCSACWHRWESLTKPAHCPEGHHPVGAEYTIEPVIGKPASHKHSSWESWRK